jgi:hypothetical protein
VIHSTQRQYKKEHDDQERNRRPDDFHSLTSRELLRVGLTLMPAETKDRVDDGGRYNDENEDEDDRRNDPQIVNRACLWRLRIQRI